MVSFHEVSGNTKTYHLWLVMATDLYWINIGLWLWLQWKRISCKQSARLAAPMLVKSLCLLLFVKIIAVKRCNIIYLGLVMASSWWSSPIWWTRKIREIFVIWRNVWQTNCSSQSKGLSTRKYDIALSLTVLKYYLLWLLGLADKFYE